jgi:hypothetical protein
MKLTLLTLLFLIGCSKTPEEISTEREIPFHTIIAFRGYCKDKGGADSIIRQSGEGNFQGECKDGTNIRFSHGDVLFHPEEKHDEGKFNVFCMVNGKVEDRTLYENLTEAEAHVILDVINDVGSTKYNSCIKQKQ